MRARTTLAGLLGLALPAGAHAQGFGDLSEAWPELARKYDADGDGTITAEEYARSERGFRNLDRNDDGVVTEEDFTGDGRGGRRRDPSRMIGGMLAAGADADDDGAITAAEWNARVASLDGDDDGALSADELAGAIGFPGAARMAQRLAGMLDHDGDGRVALEELDRLYAALDADRDGMVRGEEVPRQRRRGSRGGRGSRSGPRSLEEGVPRPGEEAPDFELPRVHDEDRTVRLSSFRGDKPVALIFGSYT